MAQRIEHLTTDQKVGGSSPSERAERIPRENTGGPGRPHLEGVGRDPVTWDEDQTRAFLMAIEGHRWEGPILLGA